MNFVNFRWELRGDRDLNTQVHQIHVRWLKLRGSDQLPTYKITLKSEEKTPGAGTFDLCNMTVRSNDRFNSGVRFRIMTPDQDLRVEEVFAVWRFIQQIQERKGIWGDLMREVDKLNGASVIVPSEDPS